VGLPTGKRRLCTAHTHLDIQPLIGPISQCAAAVARLSCCEIGVVSLQRGILDSTSPKFSADCQAISSNANRFCAASAARPMREVGMHDIVIRGGTIMDGTGKAALARRCHCRRPDHRSAG